MRVNDSAVYGYADDDQVGHVVSLRDLSVRASETMFEATDDGMTILPTWGDQSFAIKMFAINVFLNDDDESSVPPLEAPDM